MTTRTMLSSCAVGLLASVGFAGVLRVAPAGAPYTTPQAAIDAAVDGDTILIAPGVYPGFTITDEALSIAVDPPGTVHCGAVLVENVSAARNVLIDSLRITAANGIALKVRACAGSVRIQGCNVQGVDGVYNTTIPATTGAYVTGSTDVVLRTCDVRGGNGGAIYSQGYNGADALFARGSRVALYGCTLQGGYGGSADPDGSGDGGHGGDGLETPDSFVLAQQTSFRGGGGGDAGDGDFLTRGGDGGDGGHGVRLRADAPGTTPEVVTRTCTLAGGSGGIGGFWGGAFGTAGSPSSASVGTVRPAVQSTNLNVDTPSGWRVGNLVPVTVVAPPGSSVALLLGPDAGFAQNTATDYALHVPSPFFRRLALGVVPPSGSLVLNLVVPPPPAGVGSVTWHLQALAVGGGAGPTSSPATVVVY
jgi:hypothetical protein